jgi:hypothetical protein
MKSRVERFKSLHEKIDNTVDESTHSKELSSFANRLNEIDDHFEKMDVPFNDEKPSHARSFQTEEDPIFDTFENEYLKDFLDEVKAYNVEKGYRKIDDTQSNILKELHSDIKPKRVIKEADIDVKREEGSSVQEWEDFTRRNRFVEPEEEVRDIYQEVLALTQDLPMVDVEPLPVQSLTEIKAIPVEEVEVLEDVVEAVVEHGEDIDAIEDDVIEEDVIEEDVIEEGITEPMVIEPVVELDEEENVSEEVINEVPKISSQDEAIFEGFYEDADAYTPKKVRRSRLINVAINLLLVGVVLGVAILVKTFLLK